MAALLWGFLALTEGGFDGSPPLCLICEGQETSIALFYFARRMSNFNSTQSGKQRRRILRSRVLPRSPSVGCPWACKVHSRPPATYAVSSFRELNLTLLFQIVHTILVNSRQRPRRHSTGLPVFIVEPSTILPDILILVEFCPASL